MKVNLAKKIGFLLIGMGFYGLLYSLGWTEGVEKDFYGFHSAGEIPEPVTSLLVAAGGWLLYRRKRNKK